MSKIDMSKLVEDVRGLYAKDKKSQSIICLGDSVKIEYTEADLVPFPKAHPLSELLGLTGIPYNKIIQVAGKKDTGKSTWANEVMVAAQQSGHLVVLIDSEDKWDAKRFTLLGGYPGAIALIKTNEILQGAEKARRIIHAAKKQVPEVKILFVWDSVGGSQSRSHAERELDNEKHAQPGQDAKENGSVMKMLVALINTYPDSIAVYLANQTYAKIGFMQKGDQASGGAKIEYHSSFIVILKSLKILTKIVKGAKRKYGIISRATVTKNHLTQGETSLHQLDFKVTAAGSECLGETDALREEEEDNE